MIDIAALPYVPFKDRRHLPNASGVYLVLSPDGVPIYIGKAVKLRTRWEGHHRLYDVAQIVGARIAWVEVHESSELLALEEELIERFDPPLNVMRKAKPLAQCFVRLAPDLHAGLVARARSDNRSLNNLIVTWLRRALAEGW